MQWFNNLKIRSKLVLCFIILGIITGAVGVVGIYNMNLLNEASITMYNNDFLPSQDLSTIQTALQQVRANHLLVVYDRNSETFQSRQDEINRLVTQSNNLLTNYETTIGNDKDNRELYDDVMEKLLTYRTVRNENLKMIENEQYEEALSVLSEVTVARENVDKALQNLIDYNKQLASNRISNNTTQFERQTILLICLVIGGIVVAFSFGFIIANIISKQLKALVEVAEKIADGDLNIAIDVKSKDEVGILGQAFQKMNENLNNVMSNIYTAAEQVATGSKQVSGSSMSLSQGATEQASSIEELTASLEEISSQTKLNAQNANEANGLAEIAKNNAEHGNLQMGGMLKAMEEINDSSSNISKIIKVIDEIAFQTNILALNAAVEAARAGQHGKGFAVVAEEVRNLAARSANAAKETTDMIEGSIKKVESGTKIANETANALDKIVKDVTKAATLVNDIAIASNEQALGIEQINQGIMQISEVVQTNSATSEESASASEELSSQATLLRQMVNKFKLKSITNNDSIERLNPDVLNMLDKMYDKKNSVLNMQGYKEAAVAKSKIALSDNEFGKY